MEQLTATGSCCCYCNTYTENKKLVRAFAALLLSTIQSQKGRLEQTILSILLDSSQNQFAATYMVKKPTQILIG